MLFVNTRSEECRDYIKGLLTEYEKCTELDLNVPKNEERYWKAIRELQGSAYVLARWYINHFDEMKWYENHLSEIVKLKRQG